MALTPSPISCLPKPLLLPDTLFPQSVHSPPFLHRDYPYPKKTPHLTSFQNDTSRFPVSFLHLLQPFQFPSFKHPPPQTPAFFFTICFTILNNLPLLSSCSSVSPSFYLSRSF